MTNHGNFMFTFAILTFLTLFSFAASRAVNISNTWMLPEEDFPVFYRYFRDRISWYEADAVCQFHHANLVTADSSSQYDAIRAYLKELDIKDNVWIGLSKKNENSEFIWSNSKTLSGEGHWREAIPIGGDPLCVTMDSTADFLWQPYSCGGPESASFICELPVPSWALGPKGCLLTELPSLTVLYLPEQVALELTSDCGLDGTKRITCKGNADREDILKQLTCVIPEDDEFDDKVSSKLSQSTISDVTESSFESSTDIKTTTSWIWTSNTVDGYEMSTRHRRETESTVTPSEAINSEKKYDSTEPITTMNPSNYDPENTSMVIEEDPTVVTTNGVNVDAEIDKPSGPTQMAIQIVQDSNMRQYGPDTTLTADTTATADVKAADPLGEDIAEYPSAINQGQLFSFIENGTMFDIIELNDTGMEDVKSTIVNTKENTSENNENSKTTSTFSTTMLQDNKNSYTTVVYFKEPPPDSTQVTNKSPKKFDKQSKTNYYKKSDPKKINYQFEKDQRRTKDEKYSKENENKEEIDKLDLNKEVDMFPVIAPGPQGPLVKLNRTHRKELPLIDENLFKTSIIVQNQKFDENNKLGFVDHKHAEITLQKKDNNNSSNIFIVTTKFLDENSKKRNLNINESTTTFSEFHNETIHKIKSGKLEIFDSDIEAISQSTTTNKEMLIDPKLNELNKNITQNNESEIIPTITPLNEKNENYPWDKDEVMSKSLLGEIETITDDVIENNTSDKENSTLGPLNSEPVTQGRPNRRRKLTNTQRRSFYPYFFSRVLG